jgi:hypothetical protein
MKVETNTLMTIKNYAMREGVTPSYIYKLEKEGKMNCFIIDGIKFVAIDKFPSLPVVNRR